MSSAKQFIIDRENFCT